MFKIKKAEYCLQTPLQSGLLATKAGSPVSTDLAMISGAATLKITVYNYIIQYRIIEHEMALSHSLSQKNGFVTAKHFMDVS